MDAYKLSRWEKLYYPCYRFMKKFSPVDNYLSVKHFIQRGINGYDDTTWWNIDYHLYETLPPMLRKLAKQGIGVPAHIIEKSKEYDDSQLEILLKKWHEQLYNAANDIEAFWEYDALIMPQSKKARDKFMEGHKRAHERSKAGMHFVADNLFGLWD